MFKLFLPFLTIRIVLWSALALLIVFQAGYKKDKPEKDTEFSLSSLYRSHQITTEGYDRFFSFAAASQGDEKKALAETADWMQQQDGIKDVYISADTYSDLKKALNASDLDLEVTEMNDEECTAATLKTIDQYGVVIFDTHGFEDGVLTGKRFNLE